MADADSAAGMKVASCPRLYLQDLIIRFVGEICHVGAAPRPLPRLPGVLAPACRRVISAQRGLYRYFSARAKFAWKHRDTSVLHGTLRGHKCGILN